MVPSRCINRAAGIAVDGVTVVECVPLLDYGSQESKVQEHTPLNYLSEEIRAQERTPHDCEKTHYLKQTTTSNTAPS